MLTVNTVPLVLNAPSSKKATSKILKLIKPSNKEKVIQLTQQNHLLQNRIEELEEELLEVKQALKKSNYEKNVLIRCVSELECRLEIVAKLYKKLIARDLSTDLDRHQLKETIQSLTKSVTSLTRTIEEQKANFNNKLEEQVRLAMENYKLTVDKLIYLDSLTQIANRRKLDEELSDICRRNRSSVAVILSDVDYFKLFNDSMGHQAGDVALQVVALAHQMGVFRIADLVARYGGEEFMIVLPDTNEAGVENVASRTQESLELLCENFGHKDHAGNWDLSFFPEGTSDLIKARYIEILHGAQKVNALSSVFSNQNGLIHPDSSASNRLTLSMGSYSVSSATLTTPNELKQRADDRLYLAKKNGRNQIVYEGNLPEEIVPDNKNTDRRSYLKLLDGLVTYCIESGFLALGGKLP